MAHLIFALIGPSSWTAHFPECGKKAQSPVDLITSGVVKKHIELKDSFMVSSYNKMQGKCIMKNDGLHGKLNEILSTVLLFVNRN